ncbi:MAG TPA: hypothetical protein VLA19_32845 [Herpetosiphonaceae bacterium]|nr:hypothetical protein [Herpetosiphonaceae bacterium]
MGSGHFLREAFDMLVAMYRERQPELSASEIADRILTRHLHGIDIDPRAGQLAALTLYLRAWELVNEERRKQREPGAVPYRPPAMNLATTPTGLTSGALQRHLRRHPEDRILKPLLEGIFVSLEQADILGSLLRPGEHLSEAIAALRRPHTMQMDFDADDAALRRNITELAKHDPEELKRVLMERIAASFAAEAGNADDVGAALFGREAMQGVHLLRVLDRRYVVVVTNPPYLGGGNMEEGLKTFIEQSYPAGRADLFAALIIRCLEMCQSQGRVSMVGLNKWAFLGSYLELRSGCDSFAGLLRGYGIEAFCDLGQRAFSPDNKLHDGLHYLCTFNLLNLDDHHLPL